MKKLNTYQESYINLMNEGLRQKDIKTIEDDSYVSAKQLNLVMNKLRGDINKVSRAHPAEGKTKKGLPIEVKGIQDTILVDQATIKKGSVLGIDDNTGKEIKAEEDYVDTSKLSKLFIANNVIDNLTSILWKTIGGIFDSYMSIWKSKKDFQEKQRQINSDAVKQVIQDQIKDLNKETNVLAKNLAEAEERADRIETLLTSIVDNERKVIVKKEFKKEKERIRAFKKQLRKQARDL